MHNEVILIERVWEDKGERFNLNLIEVALIEEEGVAAVYV